MVFLAYVIIDCSPAFLSPLSGQGGQGCEWGRTQNGNRVKFQLNFPLAPIRNLCVNSYQWRELITFYYKLPAGRRTTAHAQLTQAHTHRHMYRCSCTAGDPPNAWSTCAHTITPPIYTHTLVSRRKVVSTFYHTSQIKGSHSGWGKGKILRQKEKWNQNVPPCQH